MMKNFPTNPSIRRGLTLVELMISVVLTLMVVFAVVRVFESLGASVTDGRATIEMSGNLRTAAQLLHDDLKGATVTSLPPRAPEQGEGYIEIIDGPSTDSQYPAIPPAGGVPYLARVSEYGGFDADRDSYLDNSAVDTCIGDIDDILALTSYRPNKPFLGTVSHPRIMDPLIGNVVQSPVAPTAVLESDTAEIVWWLQVERVPNGIGLETLAADGGLFLGYPARQIALANGTVDLTGNALSVEQQLLSVFTYPNLSPVRSLHRRVLLVRPDLNLSGIKLVGAAAVAEFLSNNDISVRVVRDTSAGAAANQYKVIANSLADLADRENRAYRSTWRYQNRTDLKRTRFGTERLGGILLDPNGMLMQQGAMKDMVLQFDTSMYAQNPSGTSALNKVIMLRKGKDVVLNDVLAFDLKVWDPQARVRAKDGTILLPHDPGYMLNGTGNLPVLGGFVDLGFGVFPKVPNTPAGVTGQFAFGPVTRSQLTIDTSSSLDAVLANGMGVATYCSWSSSYEYDGVDQDGDGIVDEGYDGLDNDGILGTDDVGERETSPPYPHALRGVKATLRTIDFSTRQVRQTSVTTDFLPE